MADILEWINFEMIDEGFNGIYVCNKKSLLYKENKLDYKPIMG